MTLLNSLRDSEKRGASLTAWPAVMVAGSVGSVNSSESIGYISLCKGGGRREGGSEGGRGGGEGGRGGGEGGEGGRGGREGMEGRKEAREGGRMSRYIYAQCPIFKPSGSCMRLCCYVFYVFFSLCLLSLL